MLRLALAGLLCLMPPALAADVSMDVAPTTLQLAPGKAGLFTITNHGARAVTVQIEATDWHQRENRDVLTPSETLFVSPPLVRIAPGAQQSVRVMARPLAAGEAQYRLIVSELPDADTDPNAVHVLLQFRVPVFVGSPRRSAPQLAFQSRRENGVTLVSARNMGAAAVKLTGVKLGDAPLPDALVYILPGAAHDFAPLASDARRLTATDSLSGQAIAADISPP